MPITGKTGIYIDGNGSAKVSLSIMEAATLPIFRHKSIGQFSEIPFHTNVSAGTAVYRLPMRTVPQTYDSTSVTAGYSNLQVPKLESVLIQLNDYGINGFLVESNDLKALATQPYDVQSATLSQWSAGIALSNALYMDCQMISTINADTDVVKVPLTTWKGTVATQTKEVAFQNFSEFSDIATDISTIINGNTVGIDRDNIKFICSAKLFKMLLTGQGVYGGDTFYAEQKEFNSKMISGVEVIRHPVFLQKFIAEIIHKTTAFDFSEILGIMFISKAFALPWANYEMYSNKDQLTNNPIIGSKFLFGYGVLRPALIKVITVPKASVLETKE